MADRIDDLREFLRTQFEHVNQRLDEHRELAAERHSDTSARLTTIDADMRTARTTLASHDEQIRTLFRSNRGEVSRLKWYVSCFVGGGVLLTWLLRLMGVL